MTMDESTTNVSAMNGDQQWMLKTNENSADLMKSEKVLPNDDTSKHSRHTFSSRQKLLEAQRRSKSTTMRKKNAVVISPVATDCSGEPRKYNDSGRSDITMETDQGFDKEASWIPQLASRGEKQQQQQQQQQTVIVSPETKTHQKQQLQLQQKQLLANFKTPQKLGKHQQIHAAVAEETPTTQLFNYYNFTNCSNSENIKPISPTTNAMLQTSPFKSSCQFLDDQLQSVLKAERSMDKKIEQMMLEGALDDSYIGGSPPSHLLNRDSDDSSGYGGVDDNKDYTRSDSDCVNSNHRKDESISTVSDVISELSDEVDISIISQPSFHTKTDMDFLTPKSRVVANDRGRRTAATVYYTARNAFEGEVNEESSTYDSDSEIYSIRRVDAKQLNQREQRPRSASYDAVSSCVAIGGNLSNIDLGKVQRSFMSPTTRVLWHGDKTPMQASSLYLDHKAPSNACGQLDTTKQTSSIQVSAGEIANSNNFTTSQTPVTYPIKLRSQKQYTHQHNNNASTPLIPKQLYNRDTSNSLNLDRIAEEHAVESFQSDSFVSLEREELLNVMKVMQLQLNELESERDLLLAERDARVMDYRDCKAENLELIGQVKTLEEGLNVMKSVNDTLASKADETESLKTSLRVKEVDFQRLKAVLLSKEGELEVLSLTLKSKEDVFEERLQSAERERLAEVIHISTELEQVHSEAIEKLQSGLQAAHASELNCIKELLTRDFDEKTSELVAAHAAQMKEMQLAHEERETSLSKSHEETIADMTKSLVVESDKHSDLLAAVQEKDALLIETKRQLLQYSAENDNIKMAQADFRAKYNALLEENALLKESNSTLEESNVELRKSVGEMSGNITELRHALADAATEREEVARSLDDAKNNVKTLEDQITSIDSRLHNKIQRIEELEEERKSAAHRESDNSHQIQLLQSDVASATEERNKMTADLEALACLEKETREKLAAVEKQNSSLIEEVVMLQSQLTVANTERENLSNRHDELSSTNQANQLRLSELAAENRALTRVRNILQLKSEKIESCNASAAAEVAELHNTIRVLNEENKLIKDELERLKSQLLTESEAVECLASEKSRIELQLCSTQTEKDDLQRKFSELVTSHETIMSSLEDSRMQVQLQSNDIESLNASVGVERDEVQKKMEILRKEKSDVDVLLSSTQKENDDLQRKLDEAVVSVDSMFLSLADARLKMQVQSTQLQELELHLAKTEDAYSLETSEKSALKVSFAQLEGVVSAKDTELKRLNCLLADKDEALRDLTNDTKSIRSDVTSVVKKLEVENATAINARSVLEDELECVKTQLSREREFVFNLQYQLEQAISEKNDIENDMIDIQATQLHLENHLEEVSQNRDHLKTQIEDMRDSIAALEAEKKSLVLKLDEQQEQAEHDTEKIAALETYAKSSARQIDYMEFQLVSKIDETETLNKMVSLHEGTLKDLNDEIEAIDAKKTEAEESLSSLHSKMDAVTKERDSLVLQLKSAVKELECIRVEYDKMRSGADSSTPNILDSSQDVAQSTISIEGIGHSCANMAEAKSIITELEKERFALEKEVNGLRVDFERVQGELITLKKSSKVVNQQTIALRGDVNKAKTLLSEAETIKIQLESDLEKSQQQIQQIQRSSSESYNAIVQQSQREISMLKIELESKDEAIEQLQALSKEHISKFDITSVSMQCSQQPSVVTSSERFKVEKGQSMFGILKGKRTMRKSKDQLSYRQK